jgi:hypothetical protein
MGQQLGWVVHFAIFSRFSWIVLLVADLLLALDQSQWKWSRSVYSTLREFMKRSARTASTEYVRVLRARRPPSGPASIRPSCPRSLEASRDLAYERLASSHPNQAPGPIQQLRKAGMPATRLTHFLLICGLQRCSFDGVVQLVHDALGCSGAAAAALLWGGWVPSAGSARLICKHLFADVAAASLLILAWSVVTTAIASRQ